MPRSTLPDIRPDTRRPFRKAENHGPQGVDDPFPFTVVPLIFLMSAAAVALAMMRKVVPAIGVVIHALSTVATFVDPT